MKPLNVLICGADKRTIRRIAQALSDDDVTIETHHPMNLLLSKTQGGEFCLIDLDGMNRYVLCSLLSIVRYTFPRMTVIGISARSGKKVLGDEITLDACFNMLPRLEDLIMLAPPVAGRYLYDTEPLREIDCFPRPSGNLQPI